MNCMRLLLLQFDCEKSKNQSRIYTYENNYCHLLDKFGKRKDVVLSFDIVNEAFFRKINVPKICESSIASFATLVLFEESASIVVVVRGKEKCYDVWMMKDYWDEESWMKLYNVGHVEVISRIVGFYKGKLLDTWKVLFHFKGELNFVANVLVN
ncbi:hypothetical protein Ahy_B06g084872 [Arachis hypogaea]|uniref:F-box associated domain-containing protein n=1 Tax=Arachis hypogaea TaxID=3818 RepID=A0A444YSY8_ARAHY|nr:hypothetical protein Ahy_B06g084872 [Arachis hypogaea]